MKSVSNDIIVSTIINKFEFNSDYIVHSSMTIYNFLDLLLQKTIPAYLIYKVRHSCDLFYSIPKKVNLYNFFLESIGYKKCKNCDSILPISEFPNNGNKLYSICKACKQVKCKAHYVDNKSDYIAKDAKRRASKLNATPKWSQDYDIKEFYKNRPDGYHVDHIIPLQSDIVCGLHIINNLQYLPASENLKKGNRLEV